MRNADTLHRILDLINQFHAFHVQAAECVSSMRELVLALLDSENASQSTDGLGVDPTHRLIYWRDRSAQIKSPLRFRLFARLACRPNHFVTYHQLEIEVWQGDRRSRETLRSTIRNLKDDLRRLGMSDLADAIIGEEQRYGLILDRG